MSHYFIITINNVIIMPAAIKLIAYNMARLMNAKIFLADVDPLTGVWKRGNTLSSIGLTYAMKNF